MNVTTRFFLLLFALANSVVYCAEEPRSLQGEKESKAVSGALTWNEKTDPEGKEVRAFINKLPDDIQQHIGSFLPYITINNLKKALTQKPRGIAVLPSGNFVMHDSLDRVAILNNEGKCIERYEIGLSPQSIDFDRHEKYLLVQGLSQFAVIQRDIREGHINVKNADWARFYNDTKGAKCVVYRDSESRIFYTLDLKTRTCKPFEAILEKKLITLKNKVDGEVSLPQLSDDLSTLVFNSETPASDEKNQNYLDVIELKTQKAYRVPYTRNSLHPNHFGITHDKKLIIVQEAEENFSVINYKNKDSMVLPYHSSNPLITVPRSISSMPSSYMVAPGYQIPVKIDTKQGSFYRATPLIADADWKLYLETQYDDTLLGPLGQSMQNLLTPNGHTLAYFGAQDGLLRLQDTKTNEVTVVPEITYTRGTLMKAATNTCFLIKKGGQRAPHTIAIRQTSVGEQIANRIQAAENLSLKTITSSEK